MREALQLLAHGGHDTRVVVADVHDTDAAHEVDVAAAFGVPDLRPLRAVGHHGVRGRDAARQVFLAESLQLVSAQLFCHSSTG